MNSAPATLTYPAEANAYDPEIQKNGGLTDDKERENAKSLSGFIFMCNKSTKFECYRYRVFGLPFGAKEVVEEIKPGVKLFLYDFELKLLYGVYEATSAGNVNLEPAAFGGKFPAQVQFNIFKECLPIPESSLRYLIKENYTGSKFKQELSEKQVAKLISSFRPLAAPSWQPVSQALANMPHSVMEDQLKLAGRGRLLAMEAPHLPEGQYGHIQPLVDPNSALNVNSLEHGSYRRAAHVENVHPTIDHRSLSAASSYYAFHPQRPLYAEDVACGVQEPSYSRYTTMEQRAPHDGVTVFERQYRQLPLQRESRYQDNVSAYNSNPTATDQYACNSNPAATGQYAYNSNAAVTGQYAYNSNPEATDQHAYDSNAAATYQYAYNSNSTATDQHAYHSNAAATYQYAYNSNPTATDQYTPSVLPTQHSTSYHQLPSQGRQYEDSSVAHSSNTAAPAPAPAQHTASDSQQQATAAYYPLQKEASYQDKVTAYRSHLIALAQYASSVVHVQAPVVYDQSSLRGTQQYQDSAVAYSSNPVAPEPYTPSVLQPQVHATYFPLQREALHQDNAVPYHWNPTVPAQYTSTQPQVSAADLHLQSEALHRANVAAYNSNTTAVAEYTPYDAPMPSYYSYHPGH